MNKIVIIGPFPGSEKGISFSNLIIYNALKNRGWLVKKIDTEFSRKIILESQFALNNFKIFLRIFECYKIWQVKYVYITIGISFFGILKYAPFVFLSKLLNKKIIVHVHSNYLSTIYNNLFGWKKKIVFYVLNSFNSGIVLSKSLNHNLTHFLDKNDIYIVENFISSKLLQNKIDKDYSEIKIVFLSNLLEPKGINDMLNALIKLKDQNILIKTKIGGYKDDSNNIDHLLKELPHVEYLGAVSGQEKIDLLTWGNVFCLPISFEFEGQPISLLEGMAFKNLILTTVYDGMKDVCTEDHAVFCLKNNPEDLKNKLLYIVENWSRLKDVAYKNGDYAQQNFSEDKFVNNIINVFNKTK
jgi:glycosyltransferase involved in cell wall biosynthesis